MEPEEEVRESEADDVSKWGKIASAILQMREKSFKRILKKVTNFGKEGDSVDDVRSSSFK